MQFRNALGRRWIVLGMIAAAGAVGTAGAAVVYKWIDKDGVVHYSDQPVPGAEKIVTGSNSANGIGGPVRGGNAAAVPAKPSRSPLEYDVFAVASPAREQVFFGDEIVPVRLTLEPALKPQQSLGWNLNGAPLGDHDGVLEFTLQSLPRGTYVLSATLTDLDTGNTQTSDAVTFYVRQPSELSPQHRK